MKVRSAVNSSTITSMVLRHRQHTQRARGLCFSGSFFLRLPLLTFVSSQNTTTMPCSIEELPIEAVAAILRFLDVYDLVAVSRLNRFFHDIVKDFPYLQYHFARELYDMRDVNTGCAMDIRKKVAEIERRERAWRAMDLSNKTCVKVRHQTSHIYDLSGGVYLLGDCKRYLQSRNTITLRHLDLAKCSQKKSVAEDWPELTVESDIVDMGLSLPEFDLIAIVGLIKMCVPRAHTSSFAYPISLGQQGLKRLS